MSKRIWLPSDWQRAYNLASPDDRITLFDHHYHADHCRGWEVLAWPCPTAKAVLDRALGGAA